MRKYYGLDEQGNIERVQKNSSKTYILYSGKRKDLELSLVWYLKHGYIITIKEKENE